jgi:thioredoxin-like negative regulator of GroEL
VYLRHDFSGFKGDRRFVRDDQGQKAFSKLRSSIGGVYAWRLSAMALTKEGDYRAKNKEEFDRLFKEADFTFRQAFAFCPYSPEAVFRYVQLLTQPQVNRMEDALIVAETCLKLDPYNGQVIGLVNNLRDAVKRSGEMEKTRASFQHMEDEVRNNPTNFQAAFDLASTYISMQQTGRATAVLERMVNEPRVDPNAVLGAAKAFVQMQNWPKLEMTLERLVKILPDEPETWYDLAALKATFGKQNESLAALTRALELSAKRIGNNPASSNLLGMVRSDPRFNPLRQLPEFQKLVPPP